MKTPKPFIIFCLSVLCSSAISQPGVPNQGSKADSLMNEGDVPAALAEFQRLYALNPEDHRNIYNYACALSISNDIFESFDSCLKYLNIAVEMDTTVSALIDPDFIPLRESMLWHDFESKLITMLNIKYKNPYNDIEYARSLWRLGAYDQAYFNEIGIAGRKIGFKSTVVSALWRFKFKIQIKNQEELEQLVTAKGWPKVADVGSEAAMSAYLVAMHSNDGSQKKYLPMIRLRCEEGELPWQRYANIYDRCLFNEGVPQKYGTHTKYNEKTRSEELYPLEDESKVDEWRKEIGLPPLAEYLKQFNIIFSMQNQRLP